LAIKKFSFKNSLKKNIDFTAPSLLDDESIQLFLFSDCYVGLDQQYPIKLRRANASIIRKYGLNINESKIVEIDTSYLENKKAESEDEDSISQDEQTDEANEEIIFDNW
jgi:hypothetical protein